MSPYDAREGPTHTGFSKPLHDPSSAAKQSLQTSPTLQPTFLPISTQTRDVINASTPPQSLALVDESGISSSGLGFTPLNSTLASRVASMSQLEARTPEVACDQYERGRPLSLMEPAPRRDRAFSAPEGTVIMDIQNKSLRAAQPGKPTGSTRPIIGNFPTKKSTAQEWVTDIFCVSDVLGAMLADGDRGAR